MNRRESLQIMTAAIAGIAIPGAAQANPWVARSAMRRPTETTNRSERYKRYEKLATDGDFPVLRDDHMMNIGKMICYSLDLQDEFEKITFSPFRCGILAMDSAIYGDVFLEVVKPPIVYAKYSDIPCTCQDNKKYQVLPCDTVYRIETTKGKLIEFQQSREGPDYAAIARAPISQAADTQSTAIRFQPELIVHVRPKVHKYYPYGTSCLETGRPVLDADWLKDTIDGINEVLKRMRA